MQYIRSYRSNPRVEEVGRRPEDLPASEPAGTFVPTGSDGPEAAEASSVVDGPQPSFRPASSAAPAVASDAPVESEDWYTFLGLDSSASLADIHSRISELGGSISSRRGSEIGDDTASLLSSELMDAVSVFSDERRKLLHDELLSKRPGYRVHAVEVRHRELQLSMARSNAIEARDRMEHGDRDEAIRLLRKAVELDPDAPSYRRALDACAEPERAAKVLRSWLAGPAR